MLLKFIILNTNQLNINIYMTVNIWFIKKKLIYKYRCYYNTNFNIKNCDNTANSNIIYINILKIYAFTKIYYI